MTNDPDFSDRPEMGSHVGRPASRRWTARAVVLGGLLGLVVAAIAVSVMTRLSGDSLPRMTEADFEAAMVRWDKTGPTSYDLDLLLAGNRPGKVHVEVRDGEVTRMTRDGIQPSQRRTWDYWSVAGQFDTIARELEMAKNPTKSFTPGASQVILWAEFDEHYGYPKQFRRAVLGANFEVDWTTLRFAPVESSEKKL